MSTNHNYANEIAFVGNLRSLVSTYEEIAVIRIERVREIVLAARQFREGLSGVMRDVRVVHEQQIVRILNEQKKKFSHHHAVVLLSTNSRLGGRVTAETSRAFVEYIKQNPEADPIILGQVGKEHFMSLLPDRKYTFFSISAERITAEDVKPLLEHLLKYEAVSVFFARFQNLIKQIPTHVDLGEAQISEGKTQKVPLLKSIPTPPYLFEPSLEKIVDFFNTQLFTILLQQTWNEAWLSLLGSRVTAMEQATSNIDISLKKLAWEKRREDRRIINKKQKDRLSGISLWQT